MLNGRAVVLKGPAVMLEDRTFLLKGRTVVQKDRTVMLVSYLLGKWLYRRSQGSYPFWRYVW